MINNNNVEIEDHLGIYEIDEFLKDYKTQLRLYTRLIFIKLLRQHWTIKEASELLNVSERTGRNWLKSYNGGGLDGLIPNFGGGRPSFMSDEQLNELRVILKDEKANYTITDVKKLIFEKFEINYTYKQAWFISRKKLGLNYGKPSPKSPERSTERKYELKKNTYF
jgi:transposase